MCEYANNSIDLQIRLLCVADIIQERQLVTETRAAPGCVTHCACAVQNDDAASAESGIATVTVLLRSAALIFYFYFFFPFSSKAFPTEQPDRYRHRKPVSLYNT